MRIVAKDQGWGFHQRAELLNGRLAMLGFAIGVVLKSATGQGILQQIGLRPCCITADLYLSPLSITLSLSLPIGLRP